MKAEDIIAGEDFQKCVEFHGHLCPGLTIKPDKKHLELIQKKQNGIATDAELEEFKKKYEKRTRDIFDLKKAQFDPPAKAQIQPSIPCSQCGEPTMESRLVEKDGSRICRGCSTAFTD